MEQHVKNQVDQMVQSVRTNQFQNPTGHAYMVREMTRKMLRATAHEQISRFTFRTDEARLISDAAYLHDVGKFLTPRNILHKSGRLTNQEREKLNLHTVNGAMLIYFHPQYHSLFMQKYAYEIALHHHERIDGRGYPDGLQGSELTPWTQIVSLADVYVALTEERPYRGAYSKDQAWSLITKGACGTFDEKLLRCMERHIPFQ